MISQGRTSFLSSILAACADAMSVKSRPALLQDELKEDAESLSPSCISLLISVFQASNEKNSNTKDRASRNLNDPRLRRVEATHETVFDECDQLFSSEKARVKASLITRLSLNGKTLHRVSGGLDDGTHWHLGQIDLTVDDKKSVARLKTLEAEFHDESFEKRVKPVIDDRIRLLATSPHNYKLSVPFLVPCAHGSLVTDQRSFLRTPRSCLHSVFFCG